ncbi:MAG: hypothetical protein R6V25_09550 [Desulfatiglandales bacterium]
MAETGFDQNIAKFVVAGIIPVLVLISSILAGFYLNGWLAVLGVG